MPTPNQQGLGGDVGSLKPPRMEDQVQANMIVGTGVPSPNIGSVGQVYLRLDGSANQRFYQKTAVSTWTPLTTG